MTGGGGSSVSGSAGVVAVEAEQGVEVDRAAGLVFGGLAVGDADRGDQPVPAVADGDADRGDAAVAGELARRRSMACLVRRHSSPAWLFHTTWAG